MRIINILSYPNKERFAHAQKNLFGVTSAPCSRSVVSLIKLGNPKIPMMSELKKIPIVKNSQGLWAIDLREEEGGEVSGNTLDCQCEGYWFESQSCPTCYHSVESRQLSLIPVQRSHEA